MHSSTKREQKVKRRVRVEKRTPKSNNSESQQDGSFFAEDIEYNLSAMTEDLASVGVKTIVFARPVNFSSTSYER